ncbi:MAG: hypothetical protein WC351_06535, partial [Candidatus Izemoplasmatales bacterium]
MKGLFGVLLLGLSLFVMTPLVSETYEFESVFDFDQLADVSLNNPLTEPLIIIEGHNIASGDYAYDRETDIITLKKDYLVQLAPGIYEWKAWGVNHDETLTIEILDRHQAHRIINGSFETGDLFGFTKWRVFKDEAALQAFTNSDVQAVVGENTIQASGNYYLGLNPVISESLQRERMGILSSSSFTLAGTGFITLRLGGGLPSFLTYLSVRSVEDDREVARYYPLIDPLTFPTLELRLYQVDLSAYLGELLYLEFCDYGGSSHDYLIIDDIETYHPETPVGGILLEDNRPTFVAPYPPNQVQNGSFNQELNHWTPVQGTTAYHVVDGQLQSNLGGDIATGMIRSNLFRLDGAGVISMK